MSIAFIFPGQGSQSVGMLTTLSEAYPVVKETFDEAAEALKKDLWQLVSTGPEADLNQTDNTQPAMLASDIACWRVWQLQGGAGASFLAGHSLGEYAALVAAGLLEFADAIKLVAERGRLMQTAVPEGVGGMAAILGLADERVIQACAAAAADEVVQAVNFNAPGQVVIAGHASAVDRAIDACKAAGAKRALRLPVSVPSHCDLMKPAAEQLQPSLARLALSDPIIPVVQNVSASIEADMAAICEAIIAQLYRPVLWVDTIKYLASQGVTRIVEMGPGKVLTGLNKRIDKSLATFPVFDPESLAKAMQGTG